MFVFLLSRIMHAPQSFFDIKPRARILDRLANDIYKLDLVLPELIRVFNSQVFRVRFMSLTTTNNGLTNPD